MDKRMEVRAKTPRYTVVEAADLVGRTADSVKRWSLGYDRTYKGKPVRDEPLIEADGPEELPLSFLNLLELELLSHYRNDAPLQAIRRALEFAGEKLGIARALISVEFKVRGGELFMEWAGTPEWAEFNASKGGQLSATRLAASVAEVTGEIDYDDASEVSFRWWYKSRSVPIYVDTRVAGGHPITAETGVRLDAIAARHREGYTRQAIMDDTGATEAEVVAAILAA